MSEPAPEWLAPGTLAEALALKAEYGEEATVVAGGTFLAILLNQRFLAPQRFISLRAIPELRGIEANGELRLGAMETHRAAELSPAVREGWPGLAGAFTLVASPRVRNQATVGGVLADADYASDPPAMLTALGARALVRSRDGEREIPLEELITGHYETSLRDDELIVGVRVPREERSTYRKFRSRSHEDRPCVGVAAALRGGSLRVVVGAVAARPQWFPEICALADGQELEDYRRRVIRVEVRRAVEDLVRADGL